MSDYSKYTVRLLLTTREGRLGTQILQDNALPMIWDRDGDDETVEADFESLDDQGLHCHRYTIDGDKWRQLEDSGMLHYVSYWVQRGVDLVDTLDSVLAGEDPKGFNSEEEERIDEKNAEIETLQARNLELVTALAMLCDTRRQSVGRCLASDMENARAVLAR